MNRQQRDELGERVFENSVFGGRPVKLTSWCDAAAVIETLEALGFEVVGGDIAAGWPEGWAARTGPDAPIATFTPSQPEWAGHETMRYVAAPSEPREEK